MIRLPLLLLCLVGIAAGSVRKLAGINGYISDHPDESKQFYQKKLFVNVLIYFLSHIYKRGSSHASGAVFLTALLGSSKCNVIVKQFYVTDFPGFNC